jgi:hypothetical protein
VANVVSQLGSSGGGRRSDRVGAGKTDRPVVGEEARASIHTQTGVGMIQTASAGVGEQARANLSLRTTTTTPKRCAQCDRALPATSRSWRKFCSTSCRARAWREANPALVTGAGTWDLVQLHWHLGPWPLLAGNFRAGYWRGPEGCPPTCPGLTPPYTSSQPVPEGREGLPPMDTTLPLERPKDRSPRRRELVARARRSIGNVTPLLET